MSNSRPLVSFVVLCYKTEPYVGECIRSILAQQGGYDYEIVVIDDCSPDGTSGVIQTFQDDRIRFIQHRSNQGHAASITEALTASRGEYIARIDSDDRYRPDFLVQAIPKFEQYPEVGLVYGDAAIINERGEQTVATCDRIHGGQDFKGCEFIPLLEENFICAPTVIARRSAWVKCIPVPTHLAFHDWYFTTLIAREHHFYYINRVLADYRVHQGNMHTAIIRNRTEEPSIFWCLDNLFESGERTPELYRQKMQVKYRVYAKHYWTLANKYFGMQMDGDARRCYVKTMRHSPRYFFADGFVRRFAGTLMGRQLYERTKASLRSVRASTAEF